MLEAEEPGFGASGRNGGQVIQGLKHDPNEIIQLFGDTRGAGLVDFSGKAAQRTFELIEHYQLRCDAQSCGWLQPAVDRASMETIERRAKACHAVAHVPIRLLDRQETARMTGTNFYSGAWLDPRGGQLRPLSYAGELARSAVANGIHVFKRSPATKLTHSNGSWAVSVNGNIIRASQVLVCTNGYSGKLIGQMHRSHIPCSSIMCATKPLPGSLRKEIMPSGLPISDARRLLNYMRFDSEGRFLIGARGSFGLDEPESFFRRLRRTAERIFPHLCGVEWQDAWGGRFALTLDHLPHVHNPEPGLYTVIGCNGRGVALISQLGRLLADLATGRVVAQDSPLPVTGIRPVPLHPFRRPGLEAVALWYRTLDRIGL